MSKNKTLSTEETILAAAEKIFMEKGYTGTRMQEVADAANINKAMLHYYFRSKEKLFRVILTKAMNVIAPMMITCLSSDKDVLGKLEEMVTKHLAVLLERPHLPMFVMHELSQNHGAFVTEVIKAKEAQPVMLGFFQQVMAEGEAGKIRKVDPIHLLLNTMSMTVFPFIARPMLATITGLQGDTFRPILEQRREEILAFLRIALKP